MREAAGRAVSVLRKQREMNATAQLTWFFLFSPEGETLTAGVFPP